MFNNTNANWEMLRELILSRVVFWAKTKKDLSYFLANDLLYHSNVSNLLGY